MSDKENTPKHIAIIMDGNGRWAQERGLPRSRGHQEGFKRVKETVEAALEFGIEVVTFFAFSKENWLRPRQEVDLLMRYLDRELSRQVKTLQKNNIRFLVIGEERPLPKPILDKIRKAQRLTGGNTKLTVVLALNYGSRQEIVEAAKKIAAEAVKGELDIERMDTKSFSKYLYTAKLPDPDLLIRTSGEMRLSNFLLWQLSYAELYFPDKYWPDFKKEDLRRAIKVYQRRERRFGGVDVG